MLGFVGEMPSGFARHVEVDEVNATACDSPVAEPHGLQNAFLLATVNGYAPESGAASGTFVDDASDDSEACQVPGKLNVCYLRTAFREFPLMLSGPTVRSMAVADGRIGVATR
jgi:hypothetical protein